MKYASFLILKIKIYILSIEYEIEWMKTMNEFKFAAAGSQEIWRGICEKYFLSRGCFFIGAFVG